MPYLSMTRTPASIVLLCLAFAACSSARQAPPRQQPSEAGTLPAAADFQKALDGLEAARKSDPDGRKIAAEYVRTVEQIKRAADRAAEGRDYARAARLYRVLLANFSDFEAFAAKIPFNKKAVEAALESNRAAGVEIPARQALQAGNMSGALGIFQAGLKNDPADPALASGLLKTAAAVKAAGDKALAAKDFVLAGRINALLLRQFGSFEALRRDIGFSKAELEEAVSTCRESLTQTGLEEYRKGNLVKALAVWEGLLSFDPDNAEIKKAVVTAKTQADAIKKKG